MGISLFKNSLCLCGGPLRIVGNPDPRQYEILRVYSEGSNVLAEIKYANCANYEGRKILLYVNCTERALRDAEVLDPHFCESVMCISPFIRIEPTEIGWQMGKILIRDMKEASEESKEEKG